MYLAKKKIHQKVHYCLRESFADGDVLKSRNICDLGSNPARYVIYPDDGVSFYFDPELIESIEAAGVKADNEELEKLFMPFLDPETRRVIHMFSRAPAGRAAFLRKQAKRCEQAAFHPFDMRRMHYLRFGELDMRKMARAPKKIYRKLLDKSRDEIEQQFLESESVLERRERKNYVYAVFGVADHFESEISRKFPQALDQERVDRVFLEEFCAINADEGFWGDMGITGRPNEYLIRYLIWFFDADFDGGFYLEDLAWQFRRRHHGHQAPIRQAAMPVDEALSMMGLSKGDFPGMSVKSLTRQYRVMAQKHHPDKGGDHDRFIRLNRAFQELVRKAGKTRR